MSNPVQCIENGRSYPSCTAAAEAVGVSYRCIGSAITRRGTAGGFHWRYLNDTDQTMQQNFISKQTAVYCPDTGKVYSSITAAAKDNYTARSNIRRAAESGGTAAGRRWRKLLPSEYALYLRHESAKQAA